MPSGLVVGLAILALSVPQAVEAASRRHHRRAHAVAGSAEQPRSALNRSDTPGSLVDDRLYRERGYGYGGTVYDLRTGGGPALGGTCTSLADAPPSCRRGGVYGNGFIYGFGLP